MNTLGASSILLIIAVICFVLAAIGVGVTGLALTPLGLAFGFGSFLVGDTGILRRRV
jgi:hypothetical protein